MTDEQRLQMITEQLILVRDNLFRGMSKSIQKLQARSINEVLELPNHTQSPPAQQEPMDFASLFREAEKIVRGKPTWKRFIDGTPLSNDIAVWMTVFAQDFARRTSPQPAQQEPVAWKNAALRVGEDLCSVGPFGYYDMTAEQWLDWALSVVTVHSPPAQRTWVGLTDEEINKLDEWLDEQPFWRVVAFARAIEAKLKEKNT